MPSNTGEKKNYIMYAIKVAEQAVVNSGTHALLHPDQVTRLIEQTATKIQELMEKAESGN
jgi:predicted transcriptional regulator